MIILKSDMLFDNQLWIIKNSSCLILYFNIINYMFIMYVKKIFILVTFGDTF